MRWMLLLLCSIAVQGLHAAEEITSSDRALEQQAMLVLDNFMKSFNDLNIEAHRDTYHFPHYRLASGKMRVLENRDALKRDDLANFLEGIGWDHSEWDRREVSMKSENKMHVNTTFSRYRKDGSRISTYTSLYILTKENDRWGIKMRSSFAQ